MAFNKSNKLYIRKITRVDTSGTSAHRQYYVMGIENKILRVASAGMRYNATISMEDLWWGDSDSLLNFEKNIVRNMNDFPDRVCWIIHKCDYEKSTRLTSTFFYVENNKLHARWGFHDVGPVNFSDIIFCLSGKNNPFTFVPYPLENKSGPDLHLVDSIFKIIKSYAIHHIDVNNTRAVITFDDPCIKVTKKPNNLIINDFIIAILADPLKIIDIELHTKYVTIFFK